MESNAKVLHLFDFSFVEIHDPSEELTLILISSLLKDTGEAILYREIRPRDTCTKRFQLLGIATNVTKYFEGASAPLIPGANAEWEIELGMWDNHVMERYNAKVDMEFFRQAFVLKEVEEEFGVKMCGPPTSTWSSRHNKGAIRAYITNRTIVRNNGEPVTDGLSTRLSQHAIAADFRLYRRCCEGRRSVSYAMVMELDRVFILQSCYLKDERVLLHS